MITVTFNEASLSLASASDASEDDEVELINDLKATGSELGYADQITDIQSLMVLNIFSMGILAGLVMGAILWRTSR
jgi:hypothetical protein|nr:MAG TPA: hypothetical protein [Inoviridae sp.]